ncbi:DinB family protein [Paenibacillus sacheonensis]|uniref:DinB family protein n=1 Tax=Paenibacillus sacheonensis TaxID=742054 RepID=A0A7X4YU18_9BACL|nr:DinB family protein [Paenibacillus sacheonensis]MBM7568860.1 putative damage-inducible protein DinB [Paenibacillus sacheonensis]NBC72563.1 DinB family protein [Paenibacillus sacheonensis]
MNPLFKQLEFIRQLTIRAVEGRPESALNAVPNGFNNNVSWNLGHIYYVQERFAFHFAGEPMLLPDNFERMFASGTKPADWNGEAPSSETLIKLLADQQVRIQRSLQDRLYEEVKAPYTTKNGLTLRTVHEFLSYTLYHEGMHYNAIGLLLRFANREAEGKA